jgi:hypothetical protein
MALNPKRTIAVVEALVAAMANLLDNGYIRIYSSTQPANADAAFDSAAPNDQVLLAELRFGATAFASFTDGVATANAITPDSSANATGTATWFRCLASGGADVTDNVYDGSVGTATADLILNSTAIVATAAVSITSLTITEKKGA